MDCQSRSGNVIHRSQNIRWSKRSNEAITEVLGGNLMNVLVTGGAGFIGSHLVRRLVDDGHRVVVLDDLSSGSRQNLVGIDAKLEVGSVSNLLAVQRVAMNVDTIFHLATQCLVVGIDRPKHLHDVNDVGTFNICLAAKEQEAKLICVGTSEAYGDQSRFPIREDAPMHPQSLYAVTKVVGEHFVKFFHDMYDVPAVIIRPFNTFGPLQREDLDMERLMKGFNAYSGVITTFIKRLEANKNLVIFGDGHQRRDFTYVTDIVDGLILLSKLEDCEIINLGYGDDVSVLELARLLSTVWTGSQKEPDVAFANPRPKDVRRLLADISLARSYGYHPKVTFEEGLKNYVEWWKSVSHRR